MVDFATSVSQWVNATKTKGDVLLRVIANDALSRVKELTPVRTGYLRANWQASFDDEVLPVDREKESKVDLGELAGGVAGGVAGQMAGAAIGSVGGPVGTIAGGVVGGVIGGVIGGSAAKPSLKREGDPIEEAKIGDTIYILNPVQYARAIEYGTKGRSGAGMVQQTVSEMPTIAQKAADRIGNQ